MGRHTFDKLLKAMLVAAFGTLFFTLFFFHEGPLSSIKRAFLCFIGFTLIFLYIKLFISIIKVYFLKTTEMIYYRWSNMNAKIDLGLFQLFCALSAPLIIAFAIWIASGFFR